MMEEKAPQTPDTDLGLNRADAFAIVGRSILGGVPFIGAMTSEVVTYVIPNQRCERIVRMVKLLSDRVRYLEKTVLEARFNDPATVDLIEDGMHQAVRALSPERIEYIANLLASGITDDQAKASDKKHLMWLLGQLDDTEIIILVFHGCQFGHSTSFLERHEDVLRPDDLFLVSRTAHRDDSDEALLFQSRCAHLINLKLLDVVSKVDRVTQNHGIPYRRRYRISQLGELLVRTIQADKILMPDAAPPAE